MSRPAVLAVAVIASVTAVQSPAGAVDCRPRSAEHAFEELLDIAADDTPVEDEAWRIADEQEARGAFESPVTIRRIDDLARASGFVYDCTRRMYVPRSGPDPREAIQEGEEPPEPGEGGPAPNGGGTPGGALSTADSPAAAPHGGAARTPDRPAAAPATGLQGAAGNPNHPAMALQGAAGNPNEPATAPQSAAGNPNEPATAPQSAAGNLNLPAGAPQSAAGNRAALQRPGGSGAEPLGAAAVVAVVLLGAVAGGLAAARRRLG